MEPEAVARAGLVPAPVDWFESVRQSCTSSDGPGFQLEFGIAELTHLGQVETFQFDLRRDSVTHDQIDDPEDYKTEGEDEANQRHDAEELRHQLAHVAVEQTGDRTIHAVPGAAVIALAVGEEAHRE